MAVKKNELKEFKNALIARFVRELRLNIECVINSERKGDYDQCYRFRRAIRTQIDLMCDLGLISIDWNVALYRVVDSLCEKGVA